MLICANHEGHKPGNPSSSGRFSDSIRVPRSYRLRDGRATRIASLQAARPCRGRQDHNPSETYSAATLIQRDFRRARPGGITTDQLPHHHSIASRSPPGLTGWKQRPPATPLRVPLGQAQRKPIQRESAAEPIPRATPRKPTLPPHSFKEISTGLAPAGSQLTSYHNTKASHPALRPGGVASLQRSKPMGSATA